MTIAIAIIGGLLMIIGIVIIMGCASDAVESIFVTVPTFLLIVTIFILGLVASARDLECPKKDLIYCHCVNIEKPKQILVEPKTSPALAPKAEKMTQP